MITTFYNINYDNDLRIFPAEKRQISNSDNNSEFEFVPLLRGISILNSDFNDNPDEDDYLDHAFTCMRLLKTLHTQTNVSYLTSDENGIVCLPTEALRIEFVSDGNVDRFQMDFRFEPSQLYAPGRYIPFVFLGDRLQISDRNLQVVVCWRSYRMNEEGELLITEKEARACAYYWKFIDTQRKMFQGNKDAQGLIGYITAAKNKYMNQAIVPDHFSQNLFNQLADVIYSRDGKVYNKSFKAIRSS